MKVIAITAGAEAIRLQVQPACAAPVRVRAEVPTVNARRPEEGGRVLYEAEMTAPDGVYVLPAVCDGFLLSSARFTVFGPDGSRADGVRYVTDMEASYSKADVPFPQVERPVGTWLLASEEDIDFMGLGFMMNEMNQAWMLTLHPQADDVPWEYNGKTYWMNAWYLKLNDELMATIRKKKIPCLIRFINRKLYRGHLADPELYAILKHPDYEDIEHFERISAFNLTTEESEQMYEACLDFIMARYADPKSPYYAFCMIDIGNEINMSEVYYNCGHRTVGELMEEYSEALRLAWIISRRYNAQFRVNISMEPDFAETRSPYKDRYYPALDCLVYLQAICQRDGDFDWGIAEHPYPENLFCPDFWNDRTAPFSFKAPLITMRNLEIWPLVTSHPYFRYRGEPRRLIFDEQGFHTDDKHPWTEEQGAYGFVLLWEKFRRQPLIDLFLINRDADVPDDEEGGLHLGLRRSDGFIDDDHIYVKLTARKMICSAIRAMGTPEEDAWIRAARHYIGEPLYDYLLDPPLPAEEELTKVLQVYDLSAYGVSV